jgi:hypothetical protein
MSLRELMKEARYVMRAHDQNLDAWFEETGRLHTGIFKIGVLGARETASGEQTEERELGRRTLSG